MHTWANFALPTENRSHWGFSSVNGQLGGFDLADLVDLGNGRYTAGSFGTIANGGNSLPYSDLELYFAGFIPASEVPDIRYFQDGSWLMENGQRVLDADGNPIFLGTPQTITIEELIRQQGERVPNWTASQKDFRAAAILIYNAEDPPSYEQMYSVSDQVEFFSNPAPDSSRLYNFHEATRGQGSLTMDRLSDYYLQPSTRPESAPAPITLPTSHGVPPQPLNSHSHH